MDYNELTESEILENQFKKQKQASGNNNLALLESLKPQGQEKANNSVSLAPQKQKQEREPAQEPGYISTGIKYLDNKIKNKSLNAFDYYMARKYLGMDLNANLNHPSRNPKYL
ncbi:hypothetical protein [Helicobacter pylori]|uniref:hypothetical protein n=1 Tax=Helicobacter pylori TaxID=210 RepID=UPI001F0954E1|nr:hypothetical protein [Helicobacter pylori]